jgi:hypothetical protein
LPTFAPDSDESGAFASMSKINKGFKEDPESKPLEKEQNEKRN